MTSKDFPHPFKETLAQQVKQLKRLPMRISQWATMEIKENFTRGGYFDENGRFIRWKKRSGKSWGKKNSNDESRAILVKTARLKRSPRPAPLYQEARVQTDVPYAEVHQNGAKGVVTQSVKSHTRKTKKGKQNVKSHTRKVRQNIPARPFLEVGGHKIEQWGNKVLTELDQILVNTPDK